MQDITYLRDLDVAERYRTSRATIWRWTSTGRLPKPVKLSAGCSRWNVADLVAWEAERKRSVGA